MLYKDFQQANSTEIINYQCEVSESTYAGNFKITKRKKSDSMEITGVVKDKSRTFLLEYVYVTLINEETCEKQTRITKDDGKFAFNVESKGLYILDFNCQGFEGLTKKNIEIKENESITIEALLQAGSTE
jgi:hypothetical protein